MATTASFATMLNEYLANDLLKEELVKRDYLLRNIERDDSWKGGNLVVPFKAAGASSVSFGQLTLSTDIAEDSYVRGGVSTYKEVWGTMIFNQKDLYEHDQISEQNFLKILPDTVDDFISYLKNVVSTNLMNGAWFATATATGTAGGSLTVDRPDRFVIGQKVQIIDALSTSTTAYVKTINMNTSIVNFVQTRGGSTPSDLSGYTVANATKVYNDNASSAAFSSLRGALLSAANGGDTTLYGQTKTTYPYLQAINVSGSDISASNILEKIFDALTVIRKLGKGAPTDVVMSYKNIGSCMKVIEYQKGAFNVTPGSQKASQYGWMEIGVGSVTNQMLKLVGVQEMDDDIIFFIDWRALKFYSNGFFKKRKAPDGKEYFEARGQSGYTYIVDVCCFGELVVNRPSYCGVLYSISY